MVARWVVRFAVVLGLLLPLVASALEVAPGGVLPADYKPWPREVKNGDITYLIYEPQSESWNGSDLRFRAAVAVTADGGTRYGIAFGHARTWIEIGTGLVKLESIKIERVNFPTAADGGEAYLRDLQRDAAGTWLVRREQLDPSQAVEQRVPVRNDPPRIFVSYSPALLVLIDGQPVLRKLPDSPFERVINTPALLLKDPRDGRFYLHVFDGWLTAREVIGPWQTVTGDASRLDEVKVRIGTGDVDLLEGGEGRPSLKSGVPVIYLSTTPAELIVLTGEPQFEPITGTQLLWVKNTAAPLLLDTGSDHYFAVISGRWFRAPTLNGPWGFAPPDQLPGDIALIPDQHALAPVRAAVPGTPQAREAVIANSVPQTATVRRSEARFEPTIDGEPQLRSIEGTSLLHVANSPTPIIRVAADSWYAVDRGVWFTARSPRRPVGDRHLGAAGDLRHSRDLAAALRHLRQGLWGYTGRGVHGLHAGLPGHRRGTRGNRGAGHRRLRLALDRQRLVRHALDLWFRLECRRRHLLAHLESLVLLTLVGTRLGRVVATAGLGLGSAPGVGLGSAPGLGTTAPSVGLEPSSGLGTTAPGVGLGSAPGLGRMASARLPSTVTASARRVSSGRASAGRFPTARRASAGGAPAPGSSATGVAERAGLGAASGRQRARLGSGRG